MMLIPLLIHVSHAPMIGPSDGSFMLGCDNCDKWFHGSCMKLDKESSDSISKWICPPCSNTDPANPAPVDQKHTNDKKPHVQENKTTIIDDKHADISPHAPDPKTLWPPFGLRNSDEAIELLGKPVDSDVEDLDPDDIQSQSNPETKMHKEQGSAIRNPPPKKKYLSTCKKNYESSFSNAPDNSALLVAASVACLAAPIVEETPTSQDNLFLTEAAQSIALMNTSNAFSGFPSTDNSHAINENQQIEDGHSHYPNNVSEAFHAQPSNATPYSANSNWHSSGIAINSPSGENTLTSHQSSSTGPSSNFNGGQHNMMALMDAADTVMNRESNTVEIHSSYSNANNTTDHKTSNGVANLLERGADHVNADASTYQEKTTHINTIATKDNLGGPALPYNVHNTTSSFQSSSREVDGAHGHLMETPFTDAGTIHLPITAEIHGHVQAAPVNQFSATSAMPHAPPKQP